MGDFPGLVEGDAGRPIAEEKAPSTVAGFPVPPTAARLDFTAARRSDLEEMRREIPEPTELPAPGRVRERTVGAEARSQKRSRSAVPLRLDSRAEPGVDRLDEALREEDDRRDAGARCLLDDPVRRFDRQRDRLLEE